MPPHIPTFPPHISTVYRINPNAFETPHIPSIHSSLRIGQLTDSKGCVPKSFLSAVFCRFLCRLGRYLGRFGGVGGHGCDVPGVSHPAMAPSEHQP